MASHCDSGRVQRSSARPRARSQPERIGGIRDQLHSNLLLTEQEISQDLAVRISLPRSYDKFLTSD